MKPRFTCYWPNKSLQEVLQYHGESALGSYWPIEDSWPWTISGLISDELNRDSPEELTYKE